jgi:hypothetical protein
MKKQFTWMDIPIDRKKTIKNKIRINPKLSGYVPDYANILGQAILFAEQCGWQDWVITDNGKFLKRTA